MKLINNSKNVYTDSREDNLATTRKQFHEWVIALCLIRVWTYLNVMSHQSQFALFMSDDVFMCINVLWFTYDAGLFVECLGTIGLKRNIPAFDGVFLILFVVFIKRFVTITGKSDNKDILKQIEIMCSLQRTENEWVFTWEMEKSSKVTHRWLTQTFAESPRLFLLKTDKKKVVTITREIKTTRDSAELIAKMTTISSDNEI